MEIQLLALNDFHGNLEPPGGSGGLINGAPAGGVEYLATHIERAAAENPNSLVVAAGDLIGASPLISGIFHDEPTIEAMNALNLSVSSVGNHFIGETLKGTPSIVTPTGVAGLRFLDEATTANLYAARLKKQGVNAIVLLVHQGGEQNGGSDPNGCANLTGDILPIVSRLSNDISIVVSAHTHQFYNCTIGGKLVTSASSLGRMLTRITLTIDTGESPGEVTYAEAFTVQPFSNVMNVETLTGDQIRRVLEQQFDNPAPGQSRILQVSQGFTYSYDLSRPAGSRVDPASLKIGGTAVVADEQYRVATNGFLQAGGDNFTVLTEGTNLLGGDIDLDAFVAYLGAHSPVSPPPRNRISRTG